MSTKKKLNIIIVICIFENSGVCGRLVNVFVVAPESLPTLIDSSLGEAKEEAMRSNPANLFACPQLIDLSKGKGYILGLIVFPSG